MLVAGRREATDVGRRQVRRQVRRSGAALALGALLATLSGCSAERVCSAGEDPVLFLEDGRLTGGACVAAGEEPPPGYVRYPDDLEPTYLDGADEAQDAYQERLDREGPPAAGDSG